MSQTDLSRREMLKAILTAGGGLGLALVLPDKWLKPIVKKGELSPHAQASVPAPVLSKLVVSGGNPGLAQSPQTAVFEFEMSFHFDNAYTNGMSKIHGDFKWENGSTCSVEKTITPGGSTSGDYDDLWDVCAQDGCDCDATVYFLDALGRQSNSIKVAAINIPC